MAIDIDYSEHKLLIKSFAYKVLRRLRAAGAKSVEIDDVIGELNIAWVIARQRFDPQKGVPFTPYLMNGMRARVNRWAEDQIFQRQVAPLDLDATSETDSSIHEVVADPDAKSALDELITSQTAERRLRRLSPEARTVVILLNDPPDWMRQQGIAMRARAERLGSRMPYAAKGDVTIPLIYRFMGTPLQRQAKINAELRRAAASDI